jgi:glycosyltransferase involved in cell wall biosynthesis
MPLFSIILPTRNRADLLADALASVRAQEWTDYELIIVDDASTDHTRNVIAQHAPAATVVRTAAGHPAPARNAGMTHASGKYLAFLDSDDRWFPWTLAVYAHVIANHQPSLLFGALTDFAAEPPALRGSPPEVRLGADFFTLHARGNFPFPTPTLIARRDIVLRAGGFACSGTAYTDVDLVLRLGTEPCAAHIVSPPLVAYRRHDANFSSKPDSHVRGLGFIFEREHAGAYPGGSKRRLERHQCLASCARHRSELLLAERAPRAALKVWAKGLRFQLTAREFRYASRFPLRLVTSVAGALRRGP